MFSPKSTCKIMFFQCFALFLLAVCSAGGDTKITSARIVSCPGCKLNRLKEVRNFIYEDVPKYENVEWKKVQGASPVLIFLNEAEQEVEKHDLESLNRKACNDLLTSKGFKLKEREL